MAKRNIGLPLNQSTNLRGNIVEIWGNLNLPKGWRYEVRLVGFRFPKTKEYRWYATNFTSSMLLAEWIYPIYRLRWQIELFFKSIKSTLHADQISSGNENIALSIVYASILSSLIVSYLIIDKTLLLAEMELKSITAQRVMKVYSLMAFELAQCLILRDMTNISFLRKLENLLP